MPAAQKIHLPAKVLPLLSANSAKRYAMKINLFFLLPGLFMMACKMHNAPGSRETENLVPRADPRQMAVLYVQQAAEYEALCRQAYQVAQDRLALAFDKDSLENPAVILDLDETVLDNSPYAAWQVQHNRPYDPKSWQGWVELAQAEAVPGSPQFLSAADRSGVTIFYLTNRHEAGRDATLENLRKLELPQADSSQLLMRSTMSNKAPRRNAIRERGYEAFLYIGDNLGDFKQLWDDLPGKDRKAQVKKYERSLGRRFILLPNPVYGEWLKALYQHRRGMTEEAKDSARQAALKEAPLR